MFSPMFGFWKIRNEEKDKNLRSNVFTQERLLFNHLHQSPRGDGIQAERNGVKG